MRPITPKKTLVEQTYDILVEAICTGDLPPGERLTQEEIAERLNISRQPVNNALTMLKANGFVEETGRRGLVVSEISAEQFMSIYEFRSAIEPFAVRLSVQRLPDHAAAQAKEILEKGRQAVRSKNPRAQIETDFAFHEMIYGWSGNATILATMCMHWQHIRRAMGVVLRDNQSAEASWDEHTRVITAMLQGDADTAAAEMEGHIVRAQAKTASEFARIRQMAD